MSIKHLGFLGLLIFAVGCPQEVPPPAEKPKEPKKPKQEIVYLDAGQNETPPADVDSGTQTGDSVDAGTQTGDSVDAGTQTGGSNTDGGSGEAPTLDAGTTVSDPIDGGVFWYPDGGFFFPLVIYNTWESNAVGDGGNTADSDNNNNMGPMLTRLTDGGPQCRAPYSVCQSESGFGITCCNPATHKCVVRFDDVFCSPKKDVYDCEDEYGPGAKLCEGTETNMCCPANDTCPDTTPDELRYAFCVKHCPDDVDEDGNPLWLECKSYKTLNLGNGPQSRTAFVTDCCYNPNTCKPPQRYGYGPAVSCEKYWLPHIQAHGFDYGDFSACYYAREHACPERTIKCSGRCCPEGMVCASGPPGQDALDHCLPADAVSCDPESDRIDECPDYAECTDENTSVVFRGKCSAESKCEWEQQEGMTCVHGCAYDGRCPLGEPKECESSDDPPWDDPQCKPTRQCEPLEPGIRFYSEPRGAWINDAGIGKYYETLAEGICLDCRCEYEYPSILRGRLCNDAECCDCEESEEFGINCLSLDGGVTDGGVVDSGVADSGVADSGVADPGAADSGVMLCENDADCVDFNNADCVVENVTPGYGTRWFNIERGICLPQNSGPSRCGTDIKGEVICTATECSEDGLNYFDENTGEPLSNPTCND